MFDYEFPEFMNDHSDSFDEDTDDASEDDARGLPTQEYTEIREQMYQDKLAHLKKQLQQLHDGTLPEWNKKLRRQEMLYKERRRVNQIVNELEMEMIEQEFISEKKLAAREFEEHKVFLREQLIAELEEKQKMIETERHNMELTGDSMELKPISTRKLRRRQNEPGTGNGSYGNDQKRRKPMQLTAMPTYLLEESDVLDDLKIINKNKAFSNLHKPGTPSGSSSGMIGSGRSDGNGSSPSFVRGIRVEDGKLFYEERWFRRGQSVQVEQKNGDKFPAMISAIGSEAIWVRKAQDNAKLRIYISQLSKGKYFLKRRAV